MVTTLAVRSDAVDVREDDGNAPVPTDPRPDNVGPLGPRTPDAPPTWEEVAEGYGDQIYNVAYRLTGDPDDAADLAQDVFVRVFRNLHRYRPGTFDGWIYRITRNLFLDQVRRRRRVRLEPIPEEEWRAPASSEPGPPDVLERRILEAPVEQALAGLPDTFRIAVVLCDVEGLSYEEIQEVTGWPLGTVRSRIHRGRKAMRDAIVAAREAAQETGGVARRDGGRRA